MKLTACYIIASTWAEYFWLVAFYLCLLKLGLSTKVITLLIARQFFFRCVTRIEWAIWWTQNCCEKGAHHLASLYLRGIDKRISFRFIMYHLTLALYGIMFISIHFHIFCCLRWLSMIGNHTLRHINKNMCTERLDLKGSFHPHLFITIISTEKKMKTHLARLYYVQHFIMNACVCSKHFPSKKLLILIYFLLYNGERKKNRE